MAVRHFGGHEVAQQGLDRVLGHQRAAEGAAVDQRDVHLDHRGAEGVGEGPRVDRLAQGPRGQEGDFRFARLAFLRQRGGVLIPGDAGLRVEGDRRMGRAPGAIACDPEQVVDLGTLAREARGLADELVLVDGPRDQLARDAHQLLLVLDEAQADLLLGDLGVALDRFLLALELLVPQVPERRDDRREEQQHRDQRAQRREAVLLGRRLAPPPAAEQPTRQCGRRSARRGWEAGWWHGADYRLPGGGTLFAGDKHCRT
jgi:hypothetical protein